MEKRFPKKYRDSDLQGSGSGDVNATALPVAVSIAALRAASGAPTPGYAPMQDADLVNEMANVAALSLEMSGGLAPTPGGSTSPDYVRTAPKKKDVVRNPNTKPESKTYEHGIREVTLDANSNNGYYATGFINGVKVTFLLDTGASMVSIPKRIADTIGLKPEGRPQMVTTAAGVVRVHDTIIDTLKIGDIELKWVGGSINPSDGSSHILLGMSALKELHFTHANGKLVLRQNIRQ